MKSIIYKDFKLLPDNIKKYEKVPKKGELLYTILYCSYKYLITTGYGYYKGVEMPIDKTVYDWDIPSYTTGKVYDYIKLAHNNKKVYSCEALFIRIDSKYETLIKNRDERYLDIDAYRYLNYVELKNAREECSDMFNVSNTTLKV